MERHFEYRFLNVESTKGYSSPFVYIISFPNKYSGEIIMYAGHTYYDKSHIYGGLHNRVSTIVRNNKLIIMKEYIEIRGYNFTCGNYNNSYHDLYHGAEGFAIEILKEMHRDKKIVCLNENYDAQNRKRFLTTNQKEHLMNIIRSAYYDVCNKMDRWQQQTQEWQEVKASAEQMLRQYNNVDITE